MLRCPVCDGTEFDARTRELSTGHALWYGEPGRSGPKTRVFARACLGCGYLVTFVDVEKLRQRFPQPSPSDGAAV